MSEYIQATARQIEWDRSSVEEAEVYRKKDWNRFFRNSYGELVVQARNSVLWETTAPVVVLISYNTVAGHLKVRQGEGAGNPDWKKPDILNFEDRTDQLKYRSVYYVICYVEELVRRLVGGESMEQIELNPPDMEAIIKEVLDGSRRRGVQ